MQPDIWEFDGGAGEITESYYNLIYKKHREVSAKGGRVKKEREI